MFQEFFSNQNQRCVFAFVLLTIQNLVCLYQEEPNFGVWRSNSTDRSSVFVNLRTHVPEKLLQLNSETRTVQATNSYENLKVYLYFTHPILNSSAEVLNSLHTSQGSLLPINGNSLGSRRFGFMVSQLIVITFLSSHFFLKGISVFSLLCFTIILFSLMTTRWKKYRARV